MSDLNNELLIHWTSNDKETAIEMVLVYAKTAKVEQWWDEITLLVWGSSTKLVSEDLEIQDYIKQLQKSGVRVIACKKCAENYGVIQIFEKNAIELFYTGKFLTDWLKSNKKIITI